MKTATLDYDVIVVKEGGGALSEEPAVDAAARRRPRHVAALIGRRKAVHVGQVGAELGGLFVVHLAELVGRADLVVDSRFKGVVTDTYSTRDVFFCVYETYLLFRMTRARRGRMPMPKISVQ